MPSPATAASWLAPCPPIASGLEGEWESYFPRARRWNRVREVYFPRARRWKRVRFSIFLCFFLRIRLRRFLINDPMVRPR